ncbi:phage tail sheath family protein [Roseateles sp. DC23W]|uniref:Phage tail sheath family protein n=2 Tax=Pelomonas dachongensis TaxID=3299029 RepID=A0ABW7EMT7_9BURK
MASDGSEPSSTYTLAGGTDGSAPDANEYADALALFVALDDVSIVACPGYSAFFNVSGGSIYRAIQDALITHVADPRRYRMAVLDAPPDVTPNQMRDLRGLVDSNRAALYYPWIVAANPLAGPNSTQPVEITLPPSGHVCGIYARNDIERGVHKAPANEVVRGALRFEPAVNFGQQELLNPIGVNCLRALNGRGLRVWGARTISSDPEWKYLNVRRYFNYLGASIDRGTQWAVFEPNGEMLWANVRGTIGDFLYNEWRNGALLGTKPEEAFFVRCDRTTMTQNDLDNGRLICLIGVAVVKPAEFVIFRIGQKTADAKS